MPAVSVCPVRQTCTGPRANSFTYFPDCSHFRSRHFLRCAVRPFRCGVFGVQGCPEEVKPNHFLRTLGEPSRKMGIVTYLSTTRTAHTVQTNVRQRFDRYFSLIFFVVWRGSVGDSGLGLYPSHGSALIQPGGKRRKKTCA